jgi:RimJ/RimL family protein N-acetyltransferase
LTGRPTVRLRPIEDADSPSLYRWINDRSLVSLSSPYRAVTQDEHDSWLRDVMARDDVRIFSIRECSDGELIGYCQLCAIDRNLQVAELRIRIGEASARGRGLGTEALVQLLDFGFRDLALHTITLQVLEHNARAKHVYEKIGFRTEVVVQAGAVIDGEEVALVTMALESKDFLRATRY